MIPKNSSGANQPAKPGLAEDIDGDWPAAALEPLPAMPDRARKGRGAVSNRSGRFEAQARVAVDDGWSGETEDDVPPLATTLIRDTSRSIIAHNNSPDIPFDRSINPYRGCEHGCVYCYARPTHAFLGFSPGLDFETKLLFKPEAAALLRQELSVRNYKCQAMAIGTNTDAYQPIEREQRIMRSVLEVLAAFNHPVGIVTKSYLVTRDIDILGPMAAKGLAHVYLSITTLDGKLARRMEPRAAAPGRRLQAIEQLAAAGIPTGVMTAPMIPGLNDHEMEAILEEAHKRGARMGNYTALRLPLEIKDLFGEWLREHYPDRAERVFSLVRQMRGGKDYDADWSQRMRGTGPVADILRARFEAACKRLGINDRRFHMRLDTSQFAVPAGSADARGQLNLL